MALSNTLKAKLSGLAFTLGGMDVVEILPTDTLIYAAAHPEQVVGIHDEGYKLELRNIDGDYEVFNKRLESQYTATPVDSVWGNNDVDVIWMVQLLFGDYFYIAYRDDQHDRFIMVIRA